MIPNSWRAGPSRGWCRRGAQSHTSSSPMATRDRATGPSRQSASRRFGRRNSGVPPACSASRTWSFSATRTARSRTPASSDATSHARFAGGGPTCSSRRTRTGRTRTSRGGTETTASPEASWERPGLVVDITDLMDLKLKAIACHASQVRDVRAVETRMRDRATALGQAKASPTPRASTISCCRADGPLDNPAESLTWLVNKLAESELALEEGDMVLPGSSRRRFGGGLGPVAVKFV